ncbi:MAG: calcium-binding protein, partial [Paracoccus sp. (in: a-proteobacteria)]|nr:calcium-binding protein [Paracoccus sp. (in: a-proteobacteria)]
MGRLELVGNIILPRSGFTRNINDLLFVDTPRGTVLVAAGNKESGLSSYLVNDAGKLAQHLSVITQATFGTYFSAPQLGVVATGGARHIVMTGQQGSLRQGVEIGTDGVLKRHVQLFPAGQIPGDVVALKLMKMGGQDYMLAGRDGDMALVLYRLGGDGQLARIGQAGPGIRTATDSEYDDIEVVAIGGASYAVAASARGNLVAVYQVGTDGLRLVSRIDAGNQIGISAPHQIEVVTTAHGRFVVIGGAGSNSLSVLRLDAAGQMVLTDHVVDSLATRFEGVTALATVEVGGRAFIIAGGADDGISVMTLDGNGRLILLATMADSDRMALADVSAIEARVIAGKIVIFVTSATEDGVTQLIFDPGRIGVSRVASGQVAGTADNDILVGVGASSVLSGGAGDDILIAREGHVRMRGGPGADIFVPGYGAQMVTIHDFDPATDRIDLSELAYIRSVAQLEIRPTATGALLSAGPVRIEIITANGKTLPASALHDGLFLLAHFANGINYGELVMPVVPSVPGKGGGNPATPATPGSYTPPAPLPPVPPATKPLFGTPGDDRITLGAAGGMALGLAGNDLIIGGAGRNILYGGEGSDTIYGGPGADIIDGGDGNDHIEGGAGHDRIHGGAGADFINGGPGDDRLYGGPGNDTIWGGEGNDIIFGGPGSDVLRGGPGDDLIQGIAGHNTIDGGPGNDILIGGGDNNRILGGPGNDLIMTHGMGSVMIADEGDDTVYGSMGRDYIFLGEGNDLAFGRGGDDFIIGGPGDDTILGNAGNDHLIGGPGNDRLFGGPGNDILWGVEGDDFISGQEGDDALRGGEGDDTLFGGPGNDRLWGGPGNDLMHGDDGHDTLRGGDGDDTMRGGAGDDWMDGGNGNDLLLGGVGRDTLLGGPGDDWLDGGPGDDSLHGGNGNDTLIGGTGKDTLTGGAGADVFVFLPAAGGEAAGTDLITDFTSGEDMIDVSKLARGLIWMGDARLSGSGRPEIQLRDMGDRQR